MNINPFSKGNPMTMGEAALIAAIAALIIWILGFFANAQWEVITADPEQWLFNAAKDYLVNWAGTFFTLAGLEQIVKQAQKTEKKESQP